MKKIAVIGSLNMDYMIETDTFPAVGETVLGKGFYMSPGGKGANQAVAAARLGGDVTLFGSVGNDANGAELLDIIKSEKINPSYIQKVDNVTSGVAFIEVGNGHNRIVFIPGANSHTNKAYIKKVETILTSFDVFVFQLETPLEVIQAILPLLHEQGKTVILNPAPAMNLEESFIEMITYLTPNEHEVHGVLGSNDDIDSLLKRYPNKLIVTMGTEGVVYSDGEKTVRIPAIKVTPVDTTGAGDTFSGAFAVAIAEGKTISDALTFANTAAGISITKSGAQSGMPTKEEVLKRVGV
ncbi:ribokinase [bacterium LRH843]|nr:ribokinase [bacterium LRH843]